MSDSIKNVEEKNGVVVISTNGYFNNIAGSYLMKSNNINNSIKNMLKH